MSDGRELQLRCEGEVARLVIDRPERRNALSLEMWRRLPALVEKFDRSPAAKVMIVQSADPGPFAAGADIGEIMDHATGPAAAASFMDTVHRAEQAVGRCTKPTIAMIRGGCHGGGVELALACDVRFASADARFSIPPAKLGVVFSLASTQRLVGLVGPGTAADLLFSGRPFDVSEAKEMRLIERVLNPESIESETIGYAEVLCRRSQVSIRAAKRVLREIADETEESVEIASLRVEAMLSDDLQEGAAAFLQKRPPRFPPSS